MKYWILAITYLVFVGMVLAFFKGASRQDKKMEDMSDAWEELKRREKEGCE